MNSQIIIKITYKICSKTALVDIESNNDKNE